MRQKYYLRRLGTQMQRVMTSQMRRRMRFPRDYGGNVSDGDGLTARVVSDGLAVLAKVLAF